MARSLRIEYPEAMCHVMNRGNQRQNIFKKEVNSVGVTLLVPYLTKLND